MLEITQARSLSDFHALRSLQDEMAEWDAAQTLAAGHDPTELLAECYSSGAEDYLKHFTSPGAGLFLAHHGGKLAGCAGFSPVNESLAEVEKVYARPEFRSLGIGTGLLDTITTIVADRGVQVLRLETVTFMTAAIRLYSSFGFRQVPPFRPPIGNLQTISVFMECDLTTRGTAIRRG